MDIISYETLLDELGLKNLQQEFDMLFPGYTFSMDEILSKLFEGDLLGAGELFLQGVLSAVLSLS